MLNRSGRLILARSTLCAIPVHISMATKIAPWAIRAIEKLVRGFLWCGSEVAVGGKCAVAWVNAACPIQYGGLGIPNLPLMGFALRLRWLWLDRVDSDKTWSGYFSRADRSAQAFFEASVTVQVGDSSWALFWSDHWLNGCSILQLAPDLWNAVPPRIRKSHSVRDALSGRSWIQDITFARTVPVVVQYLRLWDFLQNFHLSDEPDRFIWKWSYNGEFPSSSAYRALFLGRTPLAGADRIWKVQAPGRCRFFGWLVLHGRCWTSNQLRRHGMRDSDTCALCAQDVETWDHLLIGCVNSGKLGLEFCVSTASITWHHRRSCHTSFGG
jgi:hypothetical protein